MLTLFIIISSHCLSAHNFTPCSAEVETIFSNSRSMTSNCIPMIPSLNLVSLDRSQSTSGKRSQALTKCPNKKRLNVWLEPRKQNRSPPPPQDSYSTPTFPSGYVDEGLTLNLTPMDFNLSNKKRFSTPKTGRFVCNVETGDLLFFPVLEMSTTTNEHSTVPSLSHKPRVQSRYHRPRGACYLELQGIN